MAAAWACLCGCLALVEPSAAPKRDRPLETLPRVEKNEALAREAWEKGAKAFGAGRLEEAIGHFEQTYRYSGRPGPLFSLGQAHRHRWEADEDEGQRQLAILRFRQYLEVDPDGPRRLEAERWIKELSSASELEGLGGPPPIFTRLGLTSRTPGATATIDGGPRFELPDTPDVTPGKHTIAVSAPGHHAQTRTVEVPEGSTLPVELTLDPIDALLTVRGASGADLYIDGQRVARLPTRSAVAVPPGRHQIGVARAGRSLYVRDVELDRGARERLDVTLERTGQRKAAFAVIAIGATATATSAVLMGLAFEMQRRAKAIDKDHREGSDPFPADRWADKRRFETRRNSLRTAAIATGVTGLAVLATGVVLYLTDRPPIASQLQRSRERRSRQASVRAAVDLAHDFAGASVRGAF